MWCFSPFRLNGSPDEFLDILNADRTGLPKSLPLPDVVLEDFSVGLRFMTSGLIPDDDSSVTFFQDLPLKAALECTPFFEATDPRDMVYSLLSVC